MKIYFDGCSWTRGGELSQEERTTSRWSKLVADHFDAEEKNFSLSGGSNERIIRNMMDKKNIEEYDWWSQWHFVRTEYYSGRPLEPKVIPSGWIPVNPQVNFRPEEGQDVVRFRIVSWKSTWKVGSIKILEPVHRIVSTDTFFETKEKYRNRSSWITVVRMLYLWSFGLSIHKRKKTDLQMNYDGLPRMPKDHLNVEGHRILADKIIEVAESRLWEFTLMVALGQRGQNLKTKKRKDFPNYCWLLWCRRM